METSSGSAPPVAAWQADRKGGWIPGAGQDAQEANAGGRKAAGKHSWYARLLRWAAVYNWPDTGPGARARKRADAGG